MFSSSDPLILDMDILFDDLATDVTTKTVAENWQSMLDDTVMPAQDFDLDVIIQEVSDPMMQIPPEEIASWDIDSVALYKATAESALTEQTGLGDPASIYYANSDQTYVIEITGYSAEWNTTQDIADILDIVTYDSTEGYTEILDVT